MSGVYCPIGWIDSTCSLSPEPDTGIEYCRKMLARLRKSHVKPHPMGCLKKVLSWLHMSHLHMFCNLRSRPSCILQGRCGSPLKNFSIIFLRCPHRKLKWRAGNSTIWRCISFWNMGIFQPAMLVFWPCNYYPLRSTHPAPAALTRVKCVTEDHIWGLSKLTWVLICDMSGVLSDLVLNVCFFVCSMGQLVSMNLVLLGFQAKKWDGDILYTPWLRVGDFSCCCFRWVYLEAYLSTWSKYTICWGLFQNPSQTMTCKCYFSLKEACFGRGLESQVPTCDLRSRDS